MDPPNASDYATLAGDSLGSTAVATVAGEPTDPGPARRSVLASGEAFGRYVILGSVGSGGMGTVLKAYDGSLDRAVALKLLRSGAAERHARRLTREAQALAKLSHPNVVHVYEVDQADGQWFISMELVRGETLRTWQARSHDWREIVELYVRAGEGLRAAHEAGLVHRDFKPDNCIIDESGRPKVVDFGLVREASEAGEPSDDEHATTSGPRDDERATAALTRDGAVLGTVAYMPLEQLGGKPVDARSDQFSFCVSLYEALYGQRPFSRTSVGELTAALVEGRVHPAPKGSKVPGKLRRVLLRGLETDPDLRWPSMAALLDELRRTSAPRRLGMPLLLVGLGVVGLTLGLWPRDEPEPPCQGARAQLDGVWDGARADEVEGAILGTELPYAAETWARVRPRLDAYAEAWVETHTEACLATAVRKEQSAEVLDLRMSCLRSRRQELGEAVDLLAGANATRVRSAVEVVSGLPAPSRCDDVEALRQEYPPPDDPRDAERVEVLRERMVASRSMYAAGEYTIARERIEPIVRDAESLDYVPLLVSAWFQRGLLHAKSGEYVDAEEDVVRAYRLAARHRLHRLESELSTELAFLVGGQRADGERGLWWAELALELGRGVGGGREVMALNAIGTAHKARGELDRALARHREARQLAEADPDMGSRLLATTLNHIGIVLQMQGELDEARDVLERVVVIREQSLGPRHPNVGGIYTNLGSVYLRQGRHDEALEHFQRALAIWEGTLEPSHPHVAGTLLNVGLVLKRQGELDEALATLRQVLETFEQSLGSEDPRYAWTLHSIGQTLQLQGKLDEALVEYRRALEILERARGREHPDVAMALQELGDALRLLERFDEAHEALSRALRIREQALGSEHPFVARSLESLAELALDREQPELAREHAERAVTVREASESTPTDLAQARFVLARASWADPTKRASAHELATRARDELAEHAAPDDEHLRSVETWLREHPGPRSP